MIRKIINFNILLIMMSCLILYSCGGVKGGDARKISPNPKDRIKKNLEEGKGFTLLGDKNKGSGYFEFASSNELWRASLDTIDFMPLATANYSGGIIVTDWYSENQQIGESLKITIRFLSNEVRSDALDIKVFYKKCQSALNCEISENDGELKNTLKKSILKKAALYEKQSKDKQVKKKNK